MYKALRPAAGAGASGCVLANRLSEDSGISILVLEAGEDHNQDERVYCPALQDKILANPDFDWRYDTEPQQHINGRVIRHPRGKVLGGSSAINSFALIYPSAAGLDAWADLGNRGWDWESMKPYYRKFQTVCPPSKHARQELSIIHDDDSIRTTDGPIQASFPLNVLPMQKVWIETFRRLGLENEAEALDGSALGGYISTNHITEKSRERSHGGVAYFDPARERPGLQLITGATVKRIVFDASTHQPTVASRVEYIQNGKIHQVCVRKDVVLAAGVFASPQILELSGIGNPELLRKHDIDVLHANPNVGENLQDHMRPGISYEAAEDVNPRYPVPREEARRLYEESRSGPWADQACYTFAYMPLQQFLSDREKAELTDLLDHTLGDPSLSQFEQKRNSFIRRMIESPSEATVTAYLARKAATPDNENRSWISIFGMLSHPFSRGHSHIRSADPTSKPTIDPGYYTHPLDMEIHARHLQAMEKLVNTEPLASKIKRGGARLPEGHDASTIEKAKALLQQTSTTNYHPCGTCSMMPESMGGVVDDRLRAYGTRNVRVVDASIMPIIPRGNIITTVYAVAEKAADIISRDLGLKRTT
ncbi:hypothetical protein LTR78_008678 [Recurvomyces mirabilis]|uniref:Alcohol oxidase n=1 Tax=Recurvomyces mirabilis TaxID=574656 RepID=A0AAE0WGV2_9PEZI|nr:hypothetical protein LTR78_008678 [Recurvomyces mirabilis]KAK5159237.1 hypothetical protein LTS14_002379 [Recurvomyces mirabilis]